MKWLESRFTKFSLTPKDICDKLVVGLPVSANYKIAAINPARDYICVEITGSDDSGVVFLTARSIEFQERQLHLNRTEVRANLQGYGYGTTLARNCYCLARTLGLERLGVTALDGGSYVWARSGFLPTPEAWNNSPCKQRIAGHMEQVPDRRSVVWAISGLQQKVRSMRDPRVEIPLGRALLTESGASWKGTLEFFENDRNTKEHHLTRARAYLKLCADE